MDRPAPTTTPDTRRDVPGPEVGLTTGWVAWTTVAFVATVLHILIDQHLGLFGQTSGIMSVLQGLWGLFQSALLGWWMLVTVLAATGDGPALRSSLVLTALLALLLNGVVAIVAAPPISDAAPWQDLAHLTATVTGFLAVRAGRRELRDRGSPPGGRLLVISIVLLLATMAVTAPLNLQALSN